MEVATQNKTLPVRVTEQDLQTLDAIAHREGRSRSAQIRYWIRNARPPRSKTGSSAPVASDSP